jgi:hypothetical protein
VIAIDWKRLVPVATPVAAVVALAAVPARACSVCYGDPESPMARGALWGVVVLGAVTYGLLMLFVGTGVYWWRRSRRMGEGKPTVDPHDPGEHQG